MLNSGERRALVTTLGRLCVRDPSKASLLVDALLNNPQALGAEVLQIALELGTPVVNAIELSLADLQRKDESDSLAVSLEQHLPWPTVALREIAVSVVARGLRNETAHDTQYVERLISLSSRYADAGQLQKALEASEKALAMVDSNPTLGLGKERVVGLLINRVVQLYASDLLRDADVLVERALRLVSEISMKEQQPWHRGHLARLLSTGALVAFKLGRADEAISNSEQAVDIFDTLVEEGHLEFRVELSRTLGNIAWFLDAKDMPVEAYELALKSVVISRRLVEIEPDRGLPELAMSLEQLASRARVLQKAGEALEASENSIKIYEQLTRTRLSSFACRLASSLSNHAVYLDDAGASNAVERLGYVRRAVKILESYESENKGAVQEELGLACITYAGALCEANQFDEAVLRLRDALRYLRRCLSPGANLRRVVAATNLVNVLNTVGREREADRLLRHASAHFDGLSPVELEAIPGIADAISHQIMEMTP